MKLHIRSEERSFTVILPTRILFSKHILKFGWKLGKRYSDAVPNISPAAVDALCDEICRIKQTHASWELVDIQSADGEQIRIVL